MKSATYLQYCPQCLTKLPPPTVKRPVCGCYLQPTATVRLANGVDLCDECCVVHYQNKFGKNSKVSPSKTAQSKTGVLPLSRPPRQTQFDFTKYSGWILGGWSQ